MATRFPGWIAASDACTRYRIAYTMLRKLVRNGVFTRGQFSNATARPPIYLRTAELDAWKTGGVAAVAPVKAKFDAAKKEVELVHAPVLGGEG